MARFLRGLLIFLLICLLNFAGIGAEAASRDLDKLYEKARFKLGNVALSAYVADDDGRRAQGLMFIESLPADTGMLFIFEHEQPQGFWMKNTLIPLSIGFLNAKGELMEVQEMRVAGSLMSLSPPSYQSRYPALYALEMAAGWFDKNKIKPGSFLKLLSPTKSALLKDKLIEVKKATKKPAKSRQ